ncbi:MAG TPA: peptide chain release factor N(5)-glutamine methyltransferase [Clostridia bacterium]|jgi:release factor glutamine methyltransferase|nr:peptide chain release factor N(5)-glutamine methyltransferase [Clostridia bacterium]HQC68787.1 peptide chain release factor N(5)-glutamine methyltransferase [Clostridia bacterium]
MVISQLIGYCSEIFKDKKEMYFFLEEVFQKDISYFYAHPDEQVEPDKYRLLLEYAERRGKNQPFEYILNKACFYGNSFYVDSHVLIPRNDTEILVEKAIAIGKTMESPRILDLACGSGCAGISIAKELAQSKVIMSDISEKCVEIANKNILINKISNCSAVQSDLFNKIEGQFDIIVSNPPYIPLHEYVALDKQVLEYEPKLALLAGEEGTEYYELISADAMKYLKKGGYILYEVGYNQASRVCDILKKYRYTDIKVHKDLHNTDRIVIARSE